MNCLPSATGARNGPVRVRIGGGLGKATALLIEIRQFQLPFRRTERTILPALRSEPSDANP